MKIGDTMKIADKVRIYPNREQERYFRMAIGHTNFVWNWALAEWNKQYQEKKDGIREKGPSWAALSRQFNAIWRTEFPWISEIQSSIRDQSFRNLGDAWSKFFKACAGDPRYKGWGKPRHKKKGQSQSFYLKKNTFNLSSTHITFTIRKLGTYACRLRPMVRFGTEPTGATVSLKNGKWYISFSFDADFDVELPESGSEVGIDRGITHFAATSDGELFDMPDVADLQKRIIKEQRRLSRKKKRSNNRKKQKLKLAKLEEKLANIRTDTLHNVTTYLANNYETIYIESLDIKSMSKKGKGKKSLNKGILHNCWGEFNRQLQYKSKWRDGAVQSVPPQYTSQRCGECEHTDPENRHGENFECVKCGHIAHADINAAKNILFCGKTGVTLSSTKLQEDFSEQELAVSCL